MRVLLAEDTIELANVLTVVLSRNKYAVDAVYNGIDALESGLTGIYDIILLDIMMPGMDGLEVLKKLRDENITTPVLVMSADTYLLIRRSIEKPAYKEKLRIRSYSRAEPNSTVFVELKKKYQSVVYKRRISLPEEEAMLWVAGIRHCHKHTQIANEVDYFMEYYRTLHPAVFLSYEREAYYSIDESDFRVTFDDNILCRQEDLSLESQVYGTPILPEGKVLMEIKCSGGIPLWMVQVLSKEHIYKTSFSKYGTAYQTMIFPQLHRACAQK